MGLKRLLAQMIEPSGTNGHVLTTVLGKSAWGPPSAPLSVQDENGTVATAVSQLDFQGLGVSAASGVGEVVVTITGPTSALIPLTSVLGGVPDLVWEADNDLALTEAPR